MILQSASAFLVDLTTPHKFWIRLSIIFGLVWLSPSHLAAIEFPQALNVPAQQIVKRMQKGGLVIYFRHATTDREHEDQHPVDIENCNSQRNLSDLGRQQARTIGSEFKRLKIPVSEVLSSPFCRCTETAKLAFGQFNVNPNFYFAVALPQNKREQQSVVLRKLLSTRPPSGNRVIVAHTSNLREATGLWPKPEGAAWVFQPEKNGSYSALGMVTPDAWKNIKTTGK